MIVPIFFFGLLLTSAIAADDDSVLCTDEICKNIVCEDLPKNCQIQNATHNGIFLPSPTTCNCCKYCIENLNEGDDCSNGDISDPKPSAICGPGLFCNNTDSSGFDGICARMVTDCTKKQDDYDKRRALGTLGFMEVRQDCDSEGYFVPYKCIPGQSCYCVNATGTRIFGESDYTAIPNIDLKCKCSLDYLEAVTLIGRELGPSEFFRCAPNGDYDTIQCMDDKCFCVDAYDGAPTYKNEPSVNITEISKETLKCYKNEEKGVYRNLCEIEYLKILKDYKENKKDGYRMILGYDFPKCDLDGTYQAVQENDTHKYCVDKTGVILTVVDKSTNAALANSMNCKCLRAEAIISSNEKPSCTENGNYAQIQCRRGKCFCVDLDGNEVCTNNLCEVDFNEQDKLSCPK